MATVIALVTAAMLCFGLAGCAPSDDSTAPADEKPASTLAASAYMDEAAQTLESFTLEQKVAQLFIIRPEDLADESDLANPSSATLRALEQRTPGGICYFDENIVSPDQTRKLLEYLEQAARTGNNLPLLPPGENAVVRLGNHYIGAQAEAITYQFTVDPD